MKRPEVLKRIDQLIDRASSSNVDSKILMFEIYMGAVTLTSLIYGANSPQMSELKEEKQRIAESKFNEHAKFDVLLHELKGILTSYRSDVAAGLIERIEDEARGEIYASLLSVAKDCLENNAKDAAAVLAAAALEDALKKYADSHAAPIDDADMSAVINTLKNRSLLKKPEAKIVQSFVTFRNKAMHAEWDKIGKPEVAGVIGFLEHFIMVHFSGGGYEACGSAEEL